MTVAGRSLTNIFYALSAELKIRGISPLNGREPLLAVDRMPDVDINPIVMHEIGFLKIN